MSSLAPALERFGLVLPPVRPGAAPAVPPPCPAPVPRKVKPKSGKYPAWATVYGGKDALCLNPTLAASIAALPPVADVLRGHGEVEILSYPGGMSALGSFPAGKRLLKSLGR